MKEMISLWGFGEVWGTFLGYVGKIIERFYESQVVIAGFLNHAAVPTLWPRSMWLKPIQPMDPTNQEEPRKTETNRGGNGDLYTFQGINISHLGKRKIIFKMPFWGDMLVPWRVSRRQAYLLKFIETQLR